MTTQSTFDYVPDEPEKKEEKPKATKKPHPDFTDAAVLAQPAAESVKPQEIIPPGAEPVETGTQVAVITRSPQEIVAMFSDENGLNPVIDEIKRRVAQEKFDVTTKAGRERIGSVARQIGSAKIKLKNAAEELTEEWRTKTNAVNAEKKRMETEMDTLRDQVLAQREEFEQREKTRVDALNARIAQIKDASTFSETPTSALVLKHIDTVAELYTHDWQEFSIVAKQEYDTTNTKLAVLLVTRKKAEDDAAELDRLRTEKAARDQKERDDKIAAEAAAQATKDAEALAEKKRLELAAQVEKDKAAAQKVIDDQAAALAIAETNRKNDHENRLQRLADMALFQDEPNAAAIKARIEYLKGFEVADWQEYKQRADDAMARVKKELTDFLNETVIAEEKAAAAAKKISDEKAAQAERDRAAAAKKIEDDAAAARAANVAHKKKINNEALAVVQGIIDELYAQGKSKDEIGKTIIIWIAEGKVPNITIKY